MAISQWCRGRTIGRGSSATVSLAAASPSGSLFAVKSAELSLSALLQREQAFLSSLRHPNVVSCLGFDVAAEAPGGRRLNYNLFLEYAPLGSLSDCIAKRGGRLEEAAIRSYTGDVLRGLAYLHAKLVAHCDVKSQNVLIWPGGRAKIADLGCARSTAGDAGRAPIAGTPMFMAPEVASGEEQGAPADIWALGCTVIEMATGRPPWPGVVDPVAVLHRIGSTSDVPECPSWMLEEGQDFLDKCLRRDARERWTAEQLLEHPFVAKQSTVSCFSESVLDQVWVSPRSTLEQGLWDSVTKEEEEEVAECQLNSPEERIQQLVDDGFTSTNWTWDDTWITVRISEEEPAVVPVAGDESISSSNLNHISSVGYAVSYYSDDLNVVGFVNQKVEEREFHMPVIDVDNDSVLCSFVAFQLVLLLFSLSLIFTSKTSLSLVSYTPKRTKIKEKGIIFKKSPAI